MFHEFGMRFMACCEHALSDAVGNHSRRDFVEFPSQFNEHWAIYPEVFSITAALQNRRGSCGSAGRQDQERPNLTWAMEGPRVLAAANFRHAMAHPAGGWPLETPMNSKSGLSRKRIRCERRAPAYPIELLSHIWGAGYSAGFTRVPVDANAGMTMAYQWFDDHCGLTRANGDPFRR